MLEKKLNCEFIRINTSKEGYDADYEAGRIQTFISMFKDKEKEKEIKEKENKIKEKENKIKEEENKNNETENKIK